MSARSIHIAAIIACAICLSAVTSALIDVWQVW